MKTFLLAVLLFAVCITSAAAQSSTESLFVGPNETKAIYPRSYHLSSLIVAPGGTLIVRSGSAHWVILWVDGTVAIHGRVIAREFQTIQQPVRDRTPDGKTISYSYPDSGVGGDGGRGGSADGGGRSMGGGLGAHGTVAWGGGGGSGGGVYISGSQSHLTAPGKTASDWHAAPMASYGPDAQGDGGRRSMQSNGGLVLIRSSGTMDLSNATFDLSGEAGPNGAGGGKGCYSYGGFLRGASGGGGGAPGGDGGRLVLIASSFEGDLSMSARLDGGAGGVGGLVECQDARGATAGSHGDRGASGVIDFYTAEQWAEQ